MLAAAFQIGIPLALVLAVLAIIAWRACVAEGRARLLLRDVLSDTEYQQLTADNYLMVTSPNVAQRSYHIPQDGSRVQMFEQGQLVCELCLRPTRVLPVSDILLLHKLLIESNEAEYLATANRFAVTGDGHSYPQVFLGYFWCW